jgi:serine/threonine protein kinase
MGVVYKAEDLTLKRCVALKVLPPHLEDTPEFQQRFVIEAQAAAALSHQNVCVVHEVGASNGQPYIAMEFVEGETLRDRVRRGPLDPGEAVGLVDQVAAGLAEAHGKGIVHRDVTSANIMVTPAGRAKVMDFGLAKLRGDEFLRALAIDPNDALSGGLHAHLLLILFLGPDEACIEVEGMEKESFAFARSRPPRTGPVTRATSCYRCRSHTGATAT